MSPKLAAEIRKAWRKLPESVRSTPASAAQIAGLEADLGRIPPDYRWFLSELGGGPVGADWIDDAISVRQSHAKFEAERESWSLGNCFIIGWDGAGNPIAIDNATGAVVSPDHNFGGVHQLGESLEALLRARVLDAG